MKTHSPTALPAKHLGNKSVWSALLILASWIPLWAGATEYHVSSTGNDTNPGSQSRPFKRIQRAANLAQPGDTVIVHGGVYRETVIPANSGTANQRIVYRAASGETVWIDGTDPLANWQLWKGAIQKAPMAGNWFSRATPGDGTNLYDPAVLNQADQIFVDGKMMPIARWPNLSTLDPSFPTKAVCNRFISKTRNANWTTGVIEDDQFDLPPSAALGAQIYFQPNWQAWSWLFSGHVTAVSGTRITFKTRSDSGKDYDGTIYDRQSRYFLFDKLALLDAPGEWYHDKSQGVLYLQSPDDKPLAGRVSAKRRLFAFDLSNKSFITIRDFNIHACTLTTDRDSGGNNVPYDATGQPLYPWRNAAFNLPYQPFHRDDYNDANSSAIFVQNCNFDHVSHFTDVSGFFEQQWGQSSGVILSGTNHCITNCHIRFSAGTGIVLLGRKSRALGNLIEDTNYAANDCGAIHTGVTERSSTDHEIAYNTVKRCGRSGIMIRQMYRRDTTDGSPWKGRVHHNDVSAFGLQDWDLGGICSTGYDSQYVRIDHNWIHDARQNADGLPGATGFSAGGVYLDFSARFLVDHNVIWNVEWGIHMQNQTPGAASSGHKVILNTVAVRSLGKPQPYGPFAFVRNSSALFQDVLVADNVILLQDSSPNFKVIDFTSASAIHRLVDNNLSGKSFTGLGLTGGTSFPAALAPRTDATKIIGRAQLRTIAPVGGIQVPDWTDQTSPSNLGAFDSGIPVWRAGHLAWPSASSTLLAE